jgi:hypothetical protein
MILLLFWIVSRYKEKFNLSVPVLVHLILHMLLALLLRVCVCVCVCVCARACVHTIIYDGQKSVTTSMN